MKKISLVLTFVALSSIGSFAASVNNGNLNKVTQIASTILGEAHWEYTNSPIYDSWGTQIGYIPTWTFYNSSNQPTCVEMEPAVLF
jgi:hypothetical protein